MQAPTHRLAALWRDLKKGLEYLTVFSSPAALRFLCQWQSVAFGLAGSSVHPFASKRWRPTVHTLFSFSGSSATDLDSRR
jgi:hypothetical protein